MNSVKAKSDKVKGHPSSLMPSLVPPPAAPNTGTRIPATTPSGGGSHQRNLVLMQRQAVAAAAAAAAAANGAGPEKTRRYK